MCPSDKSKTDKSQSKHGYAVDSTVKDESGESESEYSSYAFYKAESEDEYCRPVARSHLTPPPPPPHPNSMRSQDNPRVIIKGPKI